MTMHFGSDTEFSNKCGVTLMNTPVGRVVAEVMGDKDGVELSVLHNLNLGKESILSSTFVWGMNRHSGLGEETTYSNSFLLESNLQGRQFNLFTRLETLQLNYDELLAGVEEAHKANKGTASHAQGADGIKAARGGASASSDCGAQTRSGASASR